MNLIKIQILIFLEETNRPIPIRILNKYIAAKSEQHIRVSINDLRLGRKINRKISGRVRSELGEFVPQHYRITDNGTKYLYYTLDKIIEKEEKETGKKYAPEEMKSKLLGYRIDI